MPNVSTEDAFRKPAQIDLFAWQFQSRLLTFAIFARRFFRPIVPSAAQLRELRRIVLNAHPWLRDGPDNASAVMSAPG
jgi:hypothetical protein